MGHLLNEEQRSVVENLSENILLYASAGTGKTFTVAHRIANVLSRGLATAEEILCLTFTIKAANEMREDVARIAGAASGGVCVQTIHGFCYQLLKEEERLRGGSRCQPQVIDEVDEEGILESLYLARVNEWKLADQLKKQGRTERVEDLKKLPLCSYRQQLGWRLEDGFLTREGEFHPLPSTEGVEPPAANCPVCRTRYETGTEACATCGKVLEPIEGLPTAEPLPFFNKKKNALMGVVTLIKHARAEYGVYETGEAQDYQQAWNLLCRDKKEEAERALSYFKRGYSAGAGGLTLDEEVWAVLSRHAGELTAEYDATLAQSNQLDFDDLILRTDRYLSEEETAARYARRYRFITVDEMQDTSQTEYRLLKKLFRGNNIMLCGDIFQTIYGWRGSNPQEVLSEFEREFTPTVYAFKENYRATKTLAEAAFGYLKNSYPAFFAGDRQQLSVHSAEQGEKILCLGFDSLREEAAQIYAYLQKHRPQEVGEVCVMARSNGYIANLSAAFERLNGMQKREEDKVRFFTVEKDQAFFKRACIKDVLALLRLLINPEDWVSMQRIAGKYVRGVGAKTLEGLRGLAEIGLSAASFLDSSAIRGTDPYGSLIEAAQSGSIVVYDTETTGLDLSKDEMVQLSAVRMNAEGEIADTLDLFIQPTVPISQAAQETHGFDLPFLQAQGALPAKEALQRFSEFARGAVLVGHNSLRFDRPLVRRQLREEGLPPLATAGEYDTLSLAKLFLPQLPNYKLSTLCSHYGIVNEAAHNALGDITATAKVLWRLLQEKILPTQSERREAVQKHAPKFEKLYAFYCELQQLLWQNKVGDLVPRILSRMQLEKRYPAEGDREALRDVADSLRSAAVYDGESFLASYLSDAALSGSQMDVLLKKLQKVPIITVHQSKGCEFSTVLLAGVSDRFFPTALCKNTPQEEEEKKVFYVAITRAKHRLIMTRVTKDYHTGAEIPSSPYVREIPEEYVWKNKEW